MNTSNIPSKISLYFFFYHRQLYCRCTSQWFQHRWNIHNCLPVVVSQIKGYCIRDSGHLSFWQRCTHCSFVLQQISCSVLHPYCLCFLVSLWVYFDLPGQKQQLFMWQVGTVWDAQWVFQWINDPTSYLDYEHGLCETFFHDGVLYLEYINYVKQQRTVNKME